MGWDCIWEGNGEMCACTAPGSGRQDSTFALPPYRRRSVAGDPLAQPPEVDLASTLKLTVVPNRCIHYCSLH